MKESLRGDWVMMTTHQRKQVHVRSRQRRKENLLSLFRKVSKMKYSSGTEFICPRTITKISTNLSMIHDKQDSVQNCDLPNTNYLTG